MSAFALASPAAATCFGCSFQSDRSNYAFDTEGSGEQLGAGYGDISGSSGNTIKNLSGGGDSWSNTGENSGADAFASSSFKTAGKSFGLAMTFNGLAEAGSMQSGFVEGKGMALTSQGFGPFTRTDQSKFSYFADGRATNNGEAFGDVAVVGSKTTQYTYGNGDANSMTGSGNDFASAGAGSRVSTVGFAGAVSRGNGMQTTRTFEVGTVQGSGGTTANQSSNWNLGS